MDEELQRQIRQMVQEEMASASSAQTLPIQNTPTQPFVSQLISRTREMIQSSANSACASISTPPNRRSLSMVTNRSSISTPPNRNSPNHRDRISFGKRKLVEPKTVTHELQVLRFNKKSLSEYPLTNQAIIIKEVYLNLNTAMNESEIRCAIKHACSSKLVMNESEFSFVKRVSGKIIIPTTPDDFCWNYSQVKKLSGQGKIYIQMNHSISPPESESDFSDSDLPPVFFSSTEEASTSSTSLCPSLDDIIKTVKEMFPDVSADRIREVASTYDNNINEIIDCFACSPLKALANQLEGKTKRRIVVDKDYIFEECIALYKNPQFDPSTPLRIVFENEPGIDAGGLLRQFYSLFFEQIISDPALSLFEGNQFKFLPKSNSETCLSEIFVTIGKIIAHNICQNGIGFPYLAPSIYEFIASGSIQHAAMFVSLDEVTISYRHYIDQISNATEEELSNLANDSDIVQIVQEIGEFCILNKSTRDKVIQSMVVHDVLIKRKVSLDHIRQGLETLGVLKMIADHPDEMRHLFIENPLFNTERIIKHIDMKETSDEEQKTVFHSVLHTFDSNLLRKFCSFVTGADSFSIGQRLRVGFADSSSIVSSTCTLDLTIPSSISRDRDLLKSALEAVINSNYRRNFNTM